MAVNTDRCTCRWGRDYDGSEFGPCAYCEAQSDADRATEQLQADNARLQSELTQARVLMGEAHQFTVMCLAFIGRDQGTGRIGKTLDDLCALAAKLDPKLRTAAGKGEGE